MSTPYLNPVELLSLTDQAELTSTDLRKARKRFLAEMELDEREDFDFHGQLFTRNDLDLAAEASDDEEMLQAYIAAAGTPGLSAFLVNGKTSDKLCDKPLSDVRLTPLIERYFNTAYNESFSRAVQSADLFAIKRMSRWKLRFSSLNESARYEASYQQLAPKVDHVITSVAAIANGPWASKGKFQPYQQIFDDLLPRKVLVVLPVFFKDLLNRLVEGVRKSISVLNDKHKDFLMADQLIKLMLRMPHLTTKNLFDLQTQSAIIDNNLKASGQKLPPETQAYLWLRLSLALIPLCMLIWLFLSIPGRKRESLSESAAKVTTIHSSKFWPPGTTFATSLSKEEELQISIADQIRNNVYAGNSIKNIPVPREAKVPLPIKQLLQQEDLGVVGANQVLRLLYFDTIPHSKTVLSERIPPHDSPSIERIHNLDKDGLVNSEAMLKDLIRWVRTKEAAKQ